MQYPNEWTDAIDFAAAANRRWISRRAVAALLGSRMDTATNIMDVRFRDCGPDDADVEQLWRDGQNDFNPLACRSLMAGDVILTGDKKNHLILPCGTVELTPSQWTEYVNAGADERFRLLCGHEDASRLEFMEEMTNELD